MEDMSGSSDYFGSGEEPLRSGQLMYDYRMYSRITRNVRCVPE